MKVVLIGDTELIVPHIKHLKHSTVISEYTDLSTRYPVMVSIVFKTKTIYDAIEVAGRFYIEIDGETVAVNNGYFRDTKILEFKDQLKDLIFEDKGRKND